MVSNQAPQCVKSTRNLPGYLNPIAINSESVREQSSLTANSSHSSFFRALEASISYGVTEMDCHHKEEKNWSRTSFFQSGVVIRNGTPG
ncbi:hypothetical protein CDAR_229721 [Caerostris darwini]|uniref:Uncharacterized protein n=1 Tax=Caerostris darwini TaxID=1538125 RepID=A0AAV4PYG8_9ARAC|nr:hypothetical protein CDAR_229721 [Caerostris darwini]